MEHTTKTLDACFYGNREIGFDFLVDLPTGIVGQPDPMQFRYQTLTEALFAALDVAMASKFEGIVRIFEPGGNRMSVVDLTVPCLPAWGQLFWTKAPVYIVTVDQIKAAAE